MGRESNPWDADLTVIGGGAAGLTAAAAAALLGARTVLIEANRLGGDCTWRGCVPSKTLLHAARVLRQARRSRGRGLEGSLQADFESLVAHLRQVRKQIYEHADSPARFEQMGIRVMQGRARFLNPHSLEIAGSEGEITRLTSRFFVIATGSRPRRLQIDLPVLTSETLFELEQLPRRLLVVGAGPMGVEMAQAFHWLGSRVHLVSRGDRILRRDDAELADLLRQSLAADGIHVELGRSVRATHVLPVFGYRVEFSRDSAMECDAVLGAIGREPSFGDLSLENAGVTASASGITVDRHGRTSQPHIYASGDVTGRWFLTHMAEHMSRVAVTHALLRLPVEHDDAHVSWATYTDPELAHVGATEEQLRASNQRYQVHRVSLDEIDRALTDGASAGMVKVLATARGNILGASILAPAAGEMISEYAVAMKHGVTLRQISSTIHPYPTWSIGNRRAADHWLLQQRRPWMVTLLHKLFGYRGGYQNFGG